MMNFVQQCPFENAVNEKLFNKFSKQFYALYKEELEAVKANSVEHLDEEFRDLYQRIGVEVPEDGRVRRSGTRGKRRMKESDEEEEEEEEEAGDKEATEEDEEEQPDDNQEDEVAQNG
jgi:condensin complex subunit 3